ncbi:hypothetical protein ACFV2I_37580 [Streptomyces microflavus]|uniref:hypothetical protein n=1 Tax=Streptomyces microflavus TaxID=1919 RepID=UPI0036B90BBB
MEYKQPPQGTLTTRLAALTAASLLALTGCSTGPESATPAAPVSTASLSAAKRAEAKTQECADEVYAHLTGRKQPELGDFIPDPCLGMNEDEFTDTLLAVTKEIDEGKRDK